MTCSTQLLAQVPGARTMFGGVLGQQPLTGARYQQALESAAIGLNFSRRADSFLYSSDRLAQMAGNGQAVAIERATGYDQLFTDRQMIFFDSVDALAARLRALIHEPAERQAIAAAGRARYYEMFNEQIVARYIVDVAFDRHDPTRYEWPTLIA
jgi:glycosyltransferase involved in cell wall biosynthesis